MGRGRVELKRIENKINRKVTFSKRRTGLVKKAHEISVLCDAEVALIIFSGDGKLFEYSTDSCMEKILERYERYSYAERSQHCQQMGASDLQQNPQENKSIEYNKLKSRLELLQRNHRHYLGEDVDTLSMGELQNLEHQLHASLKRIRERKNHLMHESISELQKKERAMQEQNNMLTRKVAQKCCVTPPFYKYTFLRVFKVRICNFLTWAMTSNKGEGDGEDTNGATRGSASMGASASAQPWHKLIIFPPRSTSLLSQHGVLNLTLIDDFSSSRCHLNFKRLSNSSL